MESLETQHQQPCPSHHIIIGQRPAAASSILTRVHAGYFRISLSIASQALLLKILTQQANNSHIPTFLSYCSIIVWLVAVIAQVSLSILYALRCGFHFQMVKAEFFHNVGVNYLFAPWISWLLLLLSAPPSILPRSASTYMALWWAFASPVLALDVKIYGQWFTTEKRFLSMVANPTSQMSVIGNLVGARAAARMGWKESSVCMFSLGMAHYLVLFVTLYQRQSCGGTLSSLLRPVFFLFFAAPSMATLAWTSISASFDTASKMLFFLSLFLFASLACRPQLFKKSMRKFNVAWWAYSFPLTFLAIASAEYAVEVKGVIAFVLMLLLSALSFLVFIGLLLLTALNARTIFQEDDPILHFENNNNNY